MDQLDSFPLVTTVVHSVSEVLQQHKARVVTSVHVAVEGRLLPLHASVGPLSS